MTGTQHPPSDGELARRLGAADPARGVVPLTEHRIEEIMSHTTTHSAPQNAGTTDAAGPTSPQRRLRVVGGLATAAAAAAILAAVLVPRSPGGAAVALTLPDADVTMSCAPIGPEFLATSDLAFEGRVTGADGSNVTLQVLHQYTGAAADTVTIPQGTDELLELTIGRLETGGTYLISATDGVVATCGLSGVSTPELKSVYEAAFD